MEFHYKFRYCPACGSEHFVTNSVKSKHCEACDFVYYLNPSAATAAFILNEKDELLLCRRANEPAKGMLDLPGGFVDLEETVEEGIKREIKEEIDVEIDEFHYLFSIPNDYLFSDLNIPTMDLFFEAKLNSNIPIVASDDIDKAEFVPLSKINIEDFGLISIKKAVKIYLRERQQTQFLSTNYD